jgi:hypothetical protein
VNDTAYALHRAHGIDTFFTEYTLDAACNSSLTSADIVNTLAPKYGFYVLPSAEDGKVLGQITDASRLAGWSWPTRTTRWWTTRPGTCWRRWPVHGRLASVVPPTRAPSNW